jgi:hypothetical protein
MRAIRRYFAIRSYVKRLSADLRRRFGLKPFYTIDHVTKAVERGGYSKDFIAYAHATYCSRETFDEYYRPLGVKCTYDGLRTVVGRRYLSGRTDFDAEMVILKFHSATRWIGDTFTENGLGEDAGHHSL